MTEMWWEAGPLSCNSEAAVGHERDLRGLGVSIHMVVAPPGLDKSWLLAGSSAPDTGGLSLTGLAL